MTYYAALDVSLRSVALCIVDDQGAVCLERTVPSEVTDIVACLRDFDDEIEVVGFEAGTLSQYLSHGLQSDGFEVVCLEARQVNAALSAMRNKTDRNDARERVFFHAVIFRPVALSSGGEKFFLSLGWESKTDCLTSNSVNLVPCFP